MLKARIIDRQ